jgi:phosphoribosylformylglycinamidine synthase
VVSGNVSLYNETNGQSIYPTPTIGGLGLLKNLKSMMTFNFKEVDNYIMIVGDTKGHLHQSALLYDVLDYKDGPPPEINLKKERKNGLCVQQLIQKNLLKSVHDISHGGIIISLAEMCMSGSMGCKIELNNINLNKIHYLFGEDQGRYILEFNNKNKLKITNILKKNAIKFEIIGKTQKNNFEIQDVLKIPITKLKKINNNWFKKFTLN